MGSANSGASAWLRSMNSSGRGMIGSVVGQKTADAMTFASGGTGKTGFMEMVNSQVEKPPAAPDLTDQILKSVARAELARKKTGMTRDSTFVAERATSAQLDAAQKLNPPQNQHTAPPTIKPPADRRAPPPGQNRKPRAPGAP